eukprot:Gb_26954 [translate_table: standard]
MTNTSPRNATIPVRTDFIITTIHDNQSEALIVVNEGDGKQVAENHLLGFFKVTGIPSAPKGVALINVSMDVDASNVLRVFAGVSLPESEAPIVPFVEVRMPAVDNGHGWCIEAFLKKYGTSLDFCTPPKQPQQQQNPEAAPKIASKEHPSEEDGSEAGVSKVEEEEEEEDTSPDNDGIMKEQMEVIQSRGVDGENDTAISADSITRLQRGAKVQEESISKLQWTVTTCSQTHHIPAQCDQECLEKIHCWEERLETVATAFLPPHSYPGLAVVAEQPQTSKSNQ